MKRAAIIITDCDHLVVTDWCAEAGKHEGYAWPTEQLLADLRRVLARAVQRVDSLDPFYTVIDREAIARVRAAIGDS